MANESFMALPAALDSPITTKRALQRIIEEIDKILGNRGTEPYLTLDVLTGVEEVTNLSIVELAELLETAQEAITSLNLSLEELQELFTELVNSVQANSDALEYKNLGVTYQDLNATEWATLKQRGFFSALGSAIINPPVALTPGDTYNVYADTAPTPGGGVVTELVIENTTVPALTRYTRAGNTFATAVSNGWI